MVLVKQKTLLQKLKTFSEDSELTEKEALKIGRKLNKSLAKKYQ